MVRMLKKCLVSTFLSTYSPFYTVQKQGKQHSLVANIFDDVFDGIAVLCVAVHRCFALLDGIDDGRMVTA